MTVAFGVFRHSESRFPKQAVSLPTFLSPQRGNPPRAIHWIARPLKGEKK
jgi:hypothetical protein